MSKVFNLRAIPPGSSYVQVDRKTIWGNPFTHIKDRQTLAKYVVDTREESIAEHEKWIMTQPDLLSKLYQLKGKNLACWCSPSGCHGNTLHRLANRKWLVATGHSDLSEEEKDRCINVMQEVVFPHYIELFGRDNIICVTGAAPGADTAFGLAAFNTNLPFQRYVPPGYRHVFLDPVWYHFKGEDKNKALTEFDYLERVAEATRLTTERPKYERGDNFKRNEQMADVADQVFVFSRWKPSVNNVVRGGGTSHMVTYCIKQGISDPFIWINPTNGEVKRVWHREKPAA